MQMAVYSQTLMDLAPFVLQFMDNQNVSWTLLKIHNDIIIITLLLNFMCTLSTRLQYVCMCKSRFSHITKKKLWKSLVFYHFWLTNKYMQFFDYQQHITKILDGLIKGSTRDEPWLV